MICNIKTKLGYIFMTYDQALMWLDPPKLPDILDGEQTAGLGTKIKIAIYSISTNSYNEWFIVLDPHTFQPVYFHGHGSTGVQGDYTMERVTKENIPDTDDWSVFLWYVADAHHKAIWEWYEEVTGNVIRR